MKDLCLNCGKKHEKEVWGAECDCDNPDVVHLIMCAKCSNLIGYLLDDDYLNIDYIVCGECIDRQLNNEI